MVPTVSPAAPSTPWMSPCRTCSTSSYFAAPYPHAKIRRLDVSRARALNGVAAVLTADDVPAKRFGFGVQDEQILAGDKVRYVGDVIAAVAAVDEATAEQALDLIECDYAELPAALTLD